MSNKVELDSIDILPYSGSKIPVWLAALPDESFTNLDGQFVGGGGINNGGGGDWLENKVAVESLGNGLYRSDPFTGDRKLSATVWEGIDQNVTYKFYLLDANLKVLNNDKPIYSDIRISDAWTSVTIENALAFSVTDIKPYRYSYPTWTQIYAYLAGFSLASKMSTILYGTGRLDTNPLSLSDPVVVGVNSPRLTKVLSMDYGNSLSTAIAEIGDTPTKLIIKEDANITGARVVKANIILSQENSAVLVESGSGSIEFEGIGIADPTSQIAFFSGFEVDDITWTGTVHPKEISTELWNTGNDSLTDRVNRADAAFTGKTVKITAYPRTITGLGTITGYHHFHPTPGDYPNTLSTLLGNGNRQVAFELHSNTRVSGKGARFYESPTDNYCGLFYATSVSPASANFFGTNENIIVEDITCVGHEDQTNTAGQETTIHLGNARNSVIRGVTFDRTHAYAAAMGGYGASGNYAYNSGVEDCRFIGIGSQLVYISNAKNCWIRRNHFDQTATTNNSTYTVIDIEPNDATSVLENIYIEDNDMDFINETVGGKYGIGIAVQGVATNNPKSIFVRRNTILGMDYDKVIAGGDGSNWALFIGIYTTGGQDITVEDNYVRGAVGKAYALTNNRFLKFHNNKAELCGDATGLSVAANITAAAGATIIGNQFPTRGVGYDDTGIIEDELEMPFTSSGSTVTMHTSSTTVPFTFWEGLTVTANGNDYIVNVVALNTQNPSPQENFTLTTSIGTLAVQSVASASGVNTGTDTITTPSNHNFNNGARLKYVAGTTPIGNLTDGITVFVINKTADTFQVSLTEGGAARDLTGTGTGTQTFIPVLRTKFSSNSYYDNLSSGITLEPTGTSVVYSRLNDIDLVAENNLSDLDDPASALGNLGATASAAEINQFNDVSAYTETLAAASALSTTKKYSKLELAGAGAVTLAAPHASMLGQQKVIEMTVDNGDVTLSLANCEGGTAATTATFSAVGQKLILSGGATKWTIVKEFGVVLS